MDSGKVILTEKEAAEVLGTSGSTLGRLRREGKGPQHRMVGNRARYHREEVERWVKGIDPPGVPVMLSPHYGTETSSAFKGG